MRVRTPRGMRVCLLQGLLTAGVIIGCAQQADSATRRAVLVGIDNYAPGYASTLSCCVNDVQGTQSEILHADSYGRWPSGNITVLTDNAAAKPAIRSAIQQAAQNSQDGDIFLYYHTSHGGQYSGTDTYLCSYDQDYTDTEIGTDLAQFGAGVSVVVVIDACHSGGIFKSEASPSWPIIDRVKAAHTAEIQRQFQTKGLVAPLSAGDNLAFITACDYDEQSWAGTPYSLYAGLLIEACSQPVEADTNSDGQYSFLEMHDYAAPRASAQNPSQTAQLDNATLLASIAAKAYLSKDVSTATRSVSVDTVSITVSPATGTSAWGVEEVIPSGLTPSAITGPNANWNASTRKITWYATGDSTATLGYTATGAAGTYSLSGMANFDGADVSITGDAQLILGGSTAPLEGPYVIVVSASTQADPNWQAVTAALQTKYGAQAHLKTFSGSAFPGTLLGEVSSIGPRYICFVATPSEASRAYVAACHTFVRQLDADPYGDAVWGIVTGRTPTDALRVANASSFTVRNGLLKTGGGWLDFLYSGTYHSESDTGTIWTRTNGGVVDKRTDGPTDDTPVLAAALNANDVDIMVTSGHASEYNWQLHYPTASPEGYFRASAGQLYGQDAGGTRHDITTSHAKLYYAPGNCLIGHIPEDSSRDNCMALGWLGTGGAVQFAGYTVNTWFGYMGWGCADYFFRLQDRFTFAESVFFNNQALLFDYEHNTPGVNRSGLEYDRDVFAFYGDPALAARLQAVTQPDYTTALSAVTNGNTVTFTFDITMNRAVNASRPAAAWLPHRIANPQITQSAGRVVDVTDDFVLVQLWQSGDSDLAAGQNWTVQFTGQISSSSESTAVRTVSGTAVSLSVTPAPGTTAWGVEESLPAGLTPSDITGPNGNWNSTTRKITWYSTGDSAATLGYTVSGTAGTYTLSGVANFDGGADVSVTGDTQVVVPSGDSLEISPSSRDHSSAAASGQTITVTANVSWTATESLSWVTITDGASGSGNGTVTYSVTANTGSARTGTITVVGGGITRVFTVNQAQSGAAGTAVRTITGTSVSIAVTPPAVTSAWGVEEPMPSGLTPSAITGPNGSWNATTRKITWYSTGASATTLGYTVAGSAGTYTLSGLANFDGADAAITGHTQVVVPGGNTLEINPSSRDHTSAAASAQTIGVTANVAWTATESLSWVTITGGASGSGNGTVTYSVDANAGAARSGTITVSGGGITRTFTVNQVAPGPVGTAVRTVSGTSVSIVVTPAAGTSAWGLEETMPAGLTPSGITGPNGSWNATTRKITWYATGASAATLGYTVTGGPGTYTLSGVANFDGGANQTVTGDTQVVIPDEDTLEITPLSRDHTSAAASGQTIGVTANVSWTATESLSWVSITGGASGSGNGTVTYSVTENTGAARTGAITVSGGGLTRTFTVNQAAPGPVGTAVRTVSGTSVSIVVTPAAGTSAWGLEETMPAGLTPSGITGPNGSWNATTRKITWYSTGAAAATLGYTVSGTPGTYTLSGVANFDGGANQTVTGDTQVVIPDEDTLEISPSSRDHTSAAASGQTIAVSANVSWTATEGLSWVTITGGASGSGNGTVTYSVDANAGAARSGAITVSGGGITRTFTVNQAQTTTTAVRTIRNSFATATVDITVTPPNGTSAWGVEEVFPTGLSPTAITGPNGSWNSTTRKITWYATGDAPATLGYGVTHNNTTYTLSGNANFDGGLDEPITGDTRIGPFDGGSHMRYLDWFGWYNDLYWPWIWDYEFGCWLWVVDNGPENVWFWHDSAGSWMWTRTDWYRWVWFAGDPNLTWRSN